METENQTAQPEELPEVSLGRKIGLEILDILRGVAFPFIVMLVISSTVIMYAGFKADLVTSIIALVGGEIMLAAALVIFGRANGSAAYKNTVLHAQKRAIGSKDEKVLCRTGEYALWKSFVISGITCLPFLIFQTIQLCYPNTVCSFALQYVFGWAYYPFSYIGEKYMALNYILVLFPVALHTAGYCWGKKIQQRVQEQLEATNVGGGKKGRKK